MSVTLTRAAGLQLGAMIRSEAAMALDGILWELTVGLYVAGPALAPDMLLGDFTPATFPGYAPIVANTWAAPYMNQEQQLQLTSPVLSWTGGAVVTPEVILGYYAYQEGTPDVLILADSFDVPITINLPGDGLAFVINVVFDLFNHGTYLFMS